MNPERRWDEPWWAGIADSLACSAACPSPTARLAWLNQEAQQRRCCTAQGMPIRFIDARECAGQPYEAGIEASGAVPTRVVGDGAWHDLFNAIIWLHWPRSKAQINRLHGCATASPSGTRGGLRDRLTLLDENGMIWVEPDPELCSWLRARRWNALLFEGRARWPQALHLFGHALLHKMMRPFKAITAHVLILESRDTTPTPTSPRSSPSPPKSTSTSTSPSASPSTSTPAPLAVAGMRDVAAVDRLLAERLSTLADSGQHSIGRFALHPLPVLGIPGWCAANRDATFYDDASVFREARGRSRVKV